MNNVEDKEGNKTSRLKLVRKDSIGSYSWDTSALDINSGIGINEWTQSDLMKVLNPGYDDNLDRIYSWHSYSDGGGYYYVSNAGTNINNSLYWNKKSGNCYYTNVDYVTSCNFSSIGLTDDAKELMDNAVWYLGASDATATFADEIMPKTLYARERGTLTGKQCSSGTNCTDQVTRTTKWTGMVGVMYPSDYAYATGGGVTKGRDACLAASPSTWANSGMTDCRDKDWLKSSGNQWTITPIGNTSNANQVMYITSSGIIGSDNSYHNIEIRPTVYLKPTVKISGGTGIKDNPYKLSL